MSRTSSHSVSSDSTQGFSIRIGAVGKGKTCPPELRCPLPLDMAFAARYYDLSDASEGIKRGAMQTPWVGTIDLEQHYYADYSSRSDKDRDSPPDHPGYRVAPVGQLQIIIKTASSPIKVFLVPYDLRALPLGGRLLVRERTVVEDGTGSTRSETSTPAAASCPARRKEYLRYAIQLQLACYPERPVTTSPNGSATTRRPRHSAPSSTARLHIDQVSNRQYYLSKSLKVIFTAQTSGMSEILRTERHDEVVPPSEPNMGSPGRVLGFSPGSLGRRGSEDWEVVRQKWIARRELQDRALQSMSDEHGVNEPAELDEGEESAHLVSPTATTAPLPILSPIARLPTIASASSSRAISRSTTPSSTDYPALQPERAGEALMMPRPHRVGNARKVKRQASGISAERELSEKLRMMDMRNGEG